jgi:hypothetical protein
MLSGILSITLLKVRPRCERVWMKIMKACGWGSKPLTMQVDELANSDWSPSNLSPFEAPVRPSPFYSPCNKIVAVPT